MLFDHLSLAKLIHFFGTLWLGGSKDDSNFQQIPVLGSAENLLVVIFCVLIGRLSVCTINRDGLIIILVCLHIFNQTENFWVFSFKCMGNWGRRCYD